MTEANDVPGYGQHAETGVSRSARLDRILHELVSQVPEIEAASVVSFDGLPMAAALPPEMDEDRVAAMSAALLSLGERAAEGLGRGELSQVYVEGENGTVFLVSADDEAVLVAVAAKGAKAGLMLFEVRRAAAAVAQTLRVEPVLGDASAPADYSAPVDDAAAATGTDASADLPAALQPPPLHAVPQGNWFAQRQGSLMPHGSSEPSDEPNWS
jgi:predicted regulator of Ras-like GTPase activity (Roadblock/LC7/MglB family)